MSEMRPAQCLKRSRLEQIAERNAMNVLVLGGTGAIGASLVSLVGKFASRVVVTSRQPRESRDNIHYVQGDAKDPVFLGKLLQDHWDAIIDFMIYSSDSFSVKLEQLLSCTEQYFYLSSARIYAGSDEPVTEASPRLLDVSTDAAFLTTDAYPLAKARQEDLLYKSGKKNWTIIRPYITYGSERLQLGVLEKEAWLYRALQGKTVVFNEEMLKCLTTLTNGRDVARAMARLIGESAALGEAFHVTGVTHLNWEAVLCVYRRALDEHGVELKLMNVDMDSFISSHSGKYQILYDRLYDRLFDNSKISAFIDVDDFDPVEDGLYNSILDFLRKQHFRAIDWPHEAMKDRFTQEFSNPREIGDLKNIFRYLKYRFIK